jgi:hypothetical protein
MERDRASPDLRQKARKMRVSDAVGWIPWHGAARVAMQKSRFLAAFAVSGRPVAEKSAICQEKQISAGPS